ncbi:zinc-dependent alcohol dehydrogenase [Nocardioides acrostichi]|uniref:Alcohol dehydrogenase catalytic domain-containing protein n=1 Tax=Nocardioides acrostichi TaxID=2784339 RepID=A0A930V433_9ACTN|nr:alcohol dehydrogenase catalytic domain-containing protein [Nocardioides acrostichi]MBF4163350.1 alcohol dehydrogenase catalytic domain-containing protein [Nocardioides acrostichi]
MRAAQYRGAGTIAVDSAPEPEAGPGEVVVSVSYTGICGTDLHILHGHMDHRVEPPGVIGHEMSGRIASCGAGVEGLAPGDPVTVMPLVWCGTCAACRAGHRHVCQRLVFVGIDSPGSLTNRWVVPADVIVPLPADLDLRDAALVEPTAVAVHDVTRSGVVAGEKVVVVGGGPVGLLVGAVARARGAEVLVVEPSSFRGSVAREAGFEVVDPTSDDVAAHVEAWTEGAGAAVSFEVSGTQPGMSSALEVLGVRGRLVVVGIHAAAREVDLHRVFWRELTLVGARVYERADFEEAVRLLAVGEIPAELLITAVQPLDEAAEAFATLDAGGEVMKVLVDCREEQA